mmetsp:Transcript_23525/g.20877  ORF Transcript_23525/g.20877 Transcript_23525/m.20877 type:complete len:124 (-) Transcript_23525:168-539(-)
MINVPLMMVGVSAFSSDWACVKRDYRWLLFFVYFTILVLFVTFTAIVALIYVNKIRKKKMEKLLYMPEIDDPFEESFDIESNIGNNININYTVVNPSELEEESKCCTCDSSLYEGRTIAKIND